MKTNLMRVVVAAVLLSGAAARAQWGLTGLRQGQTIWALNWEVAGPIGDFQNYIKNWSLVGFSLEARYLVKKNLSVGGSFSFNRWEETYSQISVPITLPGSGATGVATGPVYRYNDMFGLRAVVHYYLGEGDSKLQPYVGAGIGGVWSYAYQQIADLANTQDSFNFIVSPEVGVLYTLLQGTTSMALNLAFRYTFTTASPGRTSNAQTIGPIIGLAWYY